MRTNASAPSMAASYRTRLHEFGLRSTPARLAVLGFLESADRPVSHADLVKALAGRDIDRVTLYRNLVDLTDVGLVRRTDLGDRVWRFESVRNGHAKHPHFTCVECGRRLCLPAESVRVAGGKGIPRSAMRAAEIQIRAVCDRCA